MALANQVTCWSSAKGDVPLNAAQAAAIGAQFGNGAAQFGTNTANPLLMGDDGNINVQIPTPVATGVSPAATGSDYVLAFFSLPAAAFDIAKRGISIFAAGNAPNTNARTIKIIVNPLTAVVGSVVGGSGITVASISNTGAQSGASGGWQIEANLFKYGAAASNTQLAIHQTGVIGSTISVLTSPTATTFNESNAILIAITGNATTTATDIVFNFLQIFATN